MSARHFLILVTCRWCTTRSSCSSTTSGWRGTPTGAPLSNVKPFVHHTYSLQRLDQGLPFPVSCCWNGMVSMNAEPFTHHSLRFRSVPEGDATDTCEDGLARAGPRIFL